MKITTKRSPHSQQLADWVTKYCTTFHEKNTINIFFQELNDTKHHDTITITHLFPHLCGFPFSSFRGAILDAVNSNLVEMYKKILFSHH